MPSARGRFHVYVVELDAAACHPDVEVGRCVYVGETWKTPVKRLDDHKAGGVTASRVVWRHGVRLRSDLYRGWGPYENREIAVRAEARLAEALVKRGYVVCNRPGPMRWRSKGLAD